MGKWQCQSMKRWTVRWYYVVRYFPSQHGDIDSVLMGTAGDTALSRIQKYKENQDNEDSLNTSLIVIAI